MSIKTVICRVIECIVVFIVIAICALLISSAIACVVVKAYEILEMFGAF